jgi:hypothetical protein
LRILLRTFRKGLLQTLKLKTKRMGRIPRPPRPRKSTNFKDLNIAMEDLGRAFKKAGVSMNMTELELNEYQEAQERLEAQRKEKKLKFINKVLYYCIWGIVIITALFFLFGCVPIKCTT